LRALGAVWFSWIEDAIEGLAGGTGHNFRFPVAAEAAASAAQIHFFARCQQLQQGETFCGFWGAYPPLVTPLKNPSYQHRHRATATHA